MSEPTPERIPESAQVLRRAEALVTGDRRVDYGPATESFEALAVIWSALLGLDTVRLSPHQVALCLAALKLWRCSTSPGSMDSWTDLAGYSALGWECSVAEAKKATP
jgi:hypothetical protein